jgi:predicted ATPase
VVESGIFTEEGGLYTVSGPIAPLMIPTSLHASLLARLDSLAPTREVAQIGAALGRSFSYELISALSLMPQQQLDSALAQLVSAELIFRRGTPPDAEYTFKHALVLTRLIAPCSRVAGSRFMPRSSRLWSVNFRTW